jgi:hypothetical protein
MAAGAATAKVRTKRERKARLKNGPCANCRTELVGAYCHACGQRAHLHDKLKHLIEEFAEGIAHFDGRLWRTLPLLVGNPGRLSREWMAGRRVRYIAPLHLFLFAVFLLFLFPNFTGRHLFDFGPAETERPTAVTAPVGERRPIEPTDVQALREEAGLPPSVIRLAELGAKLRKNPQYYGYKMEALAYKLSFVTVPISVAILWLMYAWRRQFSLYHHAVVSLYGLGLVALLCAIASLFPPNISGVLNWMILVLAPIHAVFHLRGAYGSGWIQSILRTLVLGLLTSIAFSAFLLGVVFLGLTS